MTTSVPKYIKAHQKGGLQKKAVQSWDLLRSCTLCPRQCCVDRTANEKGYCETGKKAVVYSFAPHFGEEPQLVGTNGSGTIFFSNCNLKCVFCQNHDISIDGSGQATDDEQIASIMLHLQKIGCHNINLVTPSHVVPQILNALDTAAGHGLNIPLVYNCSGYESMETLHILKDVIDIYMPDFKFWYPESSFTCCNTSDYPEIAKKAIREMYEQVGDLKVDKNGIAYSGLLVRHLVMPDSLDETFHIFKFLGEAISPDTHVNVMSQYHPAAGAFKIQKMSRLVTVQEFKKALQMAKTFNLNMIKH